VVVVAAAGDLVCTYHQEPSRHIAIDSLTVVVVRIITLVVVVVGFPESSN
jgi:hypothetical protein